MEVFTEEFDQPESAVVARIWADVLGNQYPAELAPYSYTTRSELQFVAHALAVGSGDVLVDIGWGRGRPGLWVTATTGRATWASTSHERTSERRIEPAIPDAGRRIIQKRYSTPRVSVRWLWPVASGTDSP